MPDAHRTPLERLIRRELPQRLLAGATAPLPWLPQAALRRVGDRVGDAMFRWGRRHRQTALENLGRVFPRAGAAERTAIARGSFRTLAKSAVEAIAVARRGRSCIGRRVQVEGVEHLAAARRGGRGVLLFSAHLGHWEVGGLALGALHGPLHVVARRSRSDYLEGRLKRLREGFGNFMIASAGAARAVLRVLAGGSSVALLIDQRPSTQGISMPFLGQPSRVSSTLARFSLLSGAPAVPFFALATPDGYRVRILPPIAPCGERRLGVERLTRRYAAVIEREILARPASWLWMHRRWRSCDLDPGRTQARPPARRAGGARLLELPAPGGPDWAG